MYIQIQMMLHASTDPTNITESVAWNENHSNTIMDEVSSINTIETMNNAVLVDNGTTMRNQPLQRQRRDGARERRSSITILSLNLSLLNDLRSLLIDVVETIDSAIDFVAESSFTSKFTYEVSVITLVIHTACVHVLQVMQQYTSEDTSSLSEQKNGTDSSIQISNNSNTSISFDWILPLHILFLWILPILCTLSGLSFVAAAFFQWSTTDASVFAGIIGLFLVECLVPFTAMVSTFLYFILASTGHKLVTTTLSVWLFSFCSSTYIRSLLYPQLGHG